MKVTAGSSTAQRGMRVKSFIVYLCFFSVSVMTAVMVVSLPVPAVVGMAIRVGMRRSTRKSPFKR